MEDILGQKSMKVWNLGHILIHSPPTYLSSNTNSKIRMKRVGKSLETYFPRIEAAELAIYCAQQK